MNDTGQNFMDSIAEACLLADSLAEQPNGEAKALIIRALIARITRAEEMLEERDGDYAQALADSGRMLRERNLALAAVEAQLAALRDAFMTAPHRLSTGRTPDQATLVQAWGRLDAALADTAQAAEAYRARVRADALRKARAALMDGPGGYFVWADAVRRIDRLLGVEPCDCSASGVSDVCPQHGLHAHAADERGGR